MTSRVALAATAGATPWPARTVITQLLVAVTLLCVACDKDPTSKDPAATRTYRMGFSAIPQPPGSILPPFAALGMVDTQLRPKPALPVWDSLYARRRQ